MLQNRVLEQLLGTSAYLPAVPLEVNTEDPFEAPISTCGSRAQVGHLMSIYAQDLQGTEYGASDKIKVPVSFLRSGIAGSHDYAVRKVVYMQDCKTTCRTTNHVYVFNRASVEVHPTWQSLKTADCHRGRLKPVGPEGRRGSRSAAQGHCLIAGHVLSPGARAVIYQAPNLRGIFHGGSFSAIT
jgi:hypothetical protein